MVYAPAPPPPAPTKSSGASWGGVIVAIVGAFGLIWYLSYDPKREAAKIQQEVNRDVAADVVEQYGIAKRQGDKIQICVQAGFVAAVYLQSKNEPEYQRWKAIEKEDCRRAGLRR